MHTPMWKLKVPSGHKVYNAPDGSTVLENKHQRLTMPTPHIGTWKFEWVGTPLFDGYAKIFGTSDLPNGKFRVLLGLFGNDGQPFDPNAAGLNAANVKFMVQDVFNPLMRLAEQCIELQRAANPEEFERQVQAGYERYVRGES